MRTAVLSIHPLSGKRPLGLFAAACLLLIAVNMIAGQSTLRDYPTAIISNEIAGAVAPRPLGDSRSTTYYYYFNGEQGDIFINLVTQNFAGDVDVFTFDGQRLLTRVVVLADTEPAETGRVVYLRKPEKLLIRVQGRSPGDEPATFRLKFAGSFLAIKDSEIEPVPELPSVPKPVVEVRPIETARVAKKEPTEDKADPEPDRKDEIQAEAKSAKPEIRVTDPKAAVAGDKEPVDTAKQPEPVSPRNRNQARARNVSPPTERASTQRPADKTEPASEADPMAKFDLVIVFKDGAKIQRPMTEILRFTVDRGVLTVIAKDGRNGRYSMRDIERIGIE